MEQWTALSERGRLLVSRGNGCAGAIHRCFIRFGEQLVHFETARWKTVVNLAQINDDAGSPTLLEGVITLPNDPMKYGPWAGKILTCGEVTGLLYTVDPAGTVTPYKL